MPEIIEYRAHVPVVLCLTVRGESEAAAIATVQEWLAASPLEMGIDIDASNIRAEDDPDMRLYANHPFEGISLEDLR